MLRFYDPQSGIVSLDGHDLRSIELSQLRRQVSLVTQHATLFNTTIAENIAYGSFDHSLDEIAAAAEIADAHCFIQELPDGYSTRTGICGMTLSGGQRQRIALARALLRDPAVLVLDEAFSALDTGMEERILDRLFDDKQGRTIILISHRLTSIQRCNHLLNLESGRIVGNSMLVAAPGCRIQPTGGQ
jgi:ATP-binding cassette subfamily B protein